MHARSTEIGAEAGTELSVEETAKVTYDDATDDMPERASTRETAVDAAHGQ